MSEDFEAQVVALSGMRHVRTVEGAEFYNLPIGAPITPDAIAAKIVENAAKGITPPKGALGGAKKGESEIPHLPGSAIKGLGTDAATSDKVSAIHRPQYPNVKGDSHVVGVPGSSPSADAAPAPAAEEPKPLNLKVAKPSISGNQHFSIGEGSFSAPSGSRLIKPASQPGMAYVVTPDGKVHAFNKDGEVPIPAPLDGILAQKFAGDLTNDPKYNEAQFDKTGGEFGLDQMKAGDKLTNQAGEPQFTKNADGSWKHVGIGADVEEADIKDLYDSGDLVPEKTPDTEAASKAFAGKEAQDFKSMKASEVEAALNDMQDGQAISVGSTPFTKKGDKFTDAEGKNEVTASTLALLKNTLSIGHEPTPQHDPLDETSKDHLDEGAPEPLGGKASADWAKNAKHGASFEHKGSSGNTTKWSKDAENDTWQTGKGSVLPSSKMHGFLGDGKDGTSITSHGADKPNKSEAQKGVDKAIADGKLTKDVPKDTKYKDEAPKAEASKGEQKARKLSFEEIQKAKVGDEVHLPNDGEGVNLKREKDGLWHQPGDDMGFDDEALKEDAESGNAWTAPPAKTEPKAEAPKPDAPKPDSPKADATHSYDNEPPADAKALSNPTKKDLDSLPADAIVYKKRKDFPGSVPLQRGENGLWKDLTGQDQFTYEPKDLLYDKGQHDYFVATPKAEEPKDGASEEKVKKNLDLLAQSELGAKAVEAYQAALKEEPSLANVEIKHFDKASPTPGYASMEDGGAPTVKVNKAGASSVEDTANTIFSIPGAKELFSKQLGIEPEQMTPDILAQQIILHELGHTLEFQDASIDTKKRDKEAFAKLPIPNVPTSKLMDKGSIQREDLEKAVKEHNWHKTGGARTVEEAIKRQFAAYRQMPGEKAGDEFAAKIMKEHGLLPAPSKKAEPEADEPKPTVKDFFNKLLEPVGGTEGVASKTKADEQAAAATPPKNVESQAGKFYSGADDPWADSALGKVAEVIDAPKGLTPPSIKTHEQMDSNHVPGGQSGGSFHGEGNEINLSEKDLNPEGTVIHEYAHWLDTNVFKGITKGNSDPKSPYFPFWKAVKDSGHLDDLTKETSGKEAAYYSTPKEIFARAFAQWIGKKTGLAEAEHHSLHGFKDDKFGPVSAELDKLFESKGLLKGAEHDAADAHVDAPDAPSVDEPKVTHGLLSDPGVKKVGGQTGSNEGGLYDIPMSDGSTQRYYVKTAQSDSHGEQEALANDLYRAAGIDVPEVDYNRTDGNIYSKIIVGKHDMDSRVTSDPAWKKKVQEGYAVDAWLGNRDVFGMTNDNMLTGEDGNPYRIDNGGSLHYRAQGEKKTDWGNEVTELAVFKTGKKAKTFGDMTPEQEKASAQRVVDIPDDKIREMVSQTGEPESLADTLIARKNDLAEKYDLTPSTPETPAEPSPLDTVSGNEPDPKEAEAAKAGEPTHGLLSDPGVKQIGGQTGSNEGGLYEIPMSDGTTQRYYVKRAQSDSHGQQEQLANDLYRSAGIDVPEVDYNKSDGHIYSKIVPGEHDMDEQLVSNPDWKKKVQEGYAVDAWLSNRDVFGMVNDNMLTGEDGKPYRIDNGGSLDYRAQGEKKTDFGNEVSELPIFKMGKKAKTFGDMTPEQEAASAQRVVDISDDDIRKAVSEAGEADSLADKLIARKNHLAEVYNLTPAQTDEPKGFEPVLPSAQKAAEAGVSENKPDDNAAEADLADQDAADEAAYFAEKAKQEGLPEGSTPVKGAWSDLKQGDELALVDGSGAYFVHKMGPDEYADSSGNAYSEQDMQDIENESHNNTWFALPASESNTGDLPDGVPAGASLLKNHDISGVKVGDSVFQHGNGITIEMKKVAENDWVDQDPHMGYHWDDKNVLPHPDAADEVSLYHLPGTTPEEGTAPDSLAAEGTVPNANALAYSLGDSVKGAEHLNNQQVGTVLTYTKKDGSESDYTKLDNGMWLTPYGNQMSADQLNANFTVKHIPGATPKGQPKRYGPNEPVKGWEDMQSLPAGSVVKSAGGPFKHGLVLKKEDDGTWYDTLDAAPYTEDDFNGDKTSAAGGFGDIYYVHGPEGLDQGAPGTEVTNVNAPHFAPMGTSLDLYTPTGEYVETVKKMGNGGWIGLGNYGEEYAPSTIAGYIDNGHVWVHDPTNTPGSYDPNKDRKPGLKNKVQTGGPVDLGPEDPQYNAWVQALASDAAKAEPADASKVQSGGEMTPEQYKAFLNSQMEQGHISFKKYKEDLADYEASHSTGLDVQIGGAGGKVVSKQDLIEAAKAMEAHSSFHIKYGLKNAPDNPITKDQELQDAIKEESAKAFPNLKPKPAFIAYLKQKAGVETGVEVEDTADNEHAPKVNIGNHANPTAKTVQGFDGGSFSPKEVQDAIDILEGFQGKNFKAELNKQNNALGTLNPNDIVGFDKDKTVTKQKLIDLLKTKLELHSKENVKVVSGQQVEKWEDLNAYPIGTTVTVHMGNGAPDQFYTKESDTSWGVTAYEGSHASGPITELKWNSLMGQGKTAEVHSLPDEVPNYAKVPAAVQNAGTDPAQEWDAQAVKVAPVGTVLHTKAGNIAYTKQQGGTWQGYDTKSGLAVAPVYGPEMVQKFEDGAVVHKPIPGPEFNKSGVAPGKYSTDGGKVYMIVKSDGSGVYVASTGKVSALTPAKVKANHDKGMNVYKGLPKDFPDVSPAEAKKASTGPKVKKGPVEMAAGTYYLGDPNGWKSTVYEVGEDGQVKIWPKGKNSWNHPAGDPVPLDKIKTNFWAGNIVDGQGNSVVPKGHSGGLKLWNQPTTVTQLAAHKATIEQTDGKTFLTMESVKASADAGVPLDWYKLAGLALDATGKPSFSPYALYNGDEGYEDAHLWAKQHFLDTADSLLKNADLSPAPEGGASHLFQWGAEGEAFKPEALKGVDLAPSYDNSELIQQTKQVAAAFGDGKIMQPQALSKYQKQTWLKLFNEGDFGKMYKLETGALNDKGKVHPAGYLHPGYPGNSETNKVVWGAAVPGEVPAGKVVEGDWSSVAVSNWSPEELDNYLIKAQMQYPTHINLHQKRTWVSQHLSGDKHGVDIISGYAEKQAKSGVLPISQPPVWTDNIVPAKTWTSLFDQGEFPPESVWNAASYSVQKDFLKDHKDDAALMQGVAEAIPTAGSGVSGEDLKKWAEGESVMGLSQYSVENGLKAYYAKKQEEYEEELKKPVYTKTHLLSEKGSHETWKVTDQFGREYVFKPEPEEHRQHRVEMEVASNKLGNLYGFKTPVAEAVTIDGQFGSVQKYQPNIGDFLSEDTEDGILDLHALSPKQLGQVASEHVLDWILDNDDTHAENLLLTPDGDVVGIDKGRGLFVYGNWDGASATTDAHTNNVTLVATKLYDDIRSGKMSEEQVNAAYLAAIKAAKRIQNSPDAASEALVRQAVANRTRWEVPAYMTHFDHSQAPSNEEELVKAFLDRKHSMVDTIEQMWEGVFKDSPFTKPEKPAKALGEDHLSGWEEQDTISKAEEHKVWGAAPVHASSAIVGGSSLLWTDKDPSGNINHKGQMRVGSITAQKILDYVMPLAPTGHATSNSNVVAGFPNQHLAGWKHSISAAGKDITKNSIDKNFDAAVQQNFEDTAAKIAEDQAHWSPDLTPGASGLIDFPSGATVPEYGLLQYKQALDHSQAMVDKVKAAKADGTTTDKGDFTVFTPHKLKNEGLVYTSPDGKVSYHQVADGGFLKSDGTTVTNEGIPYEATEPGSGWTKSGGSGTGVTGNGVKVTRTSAGQFQGKLGDNGELETGGEWGKQGHPGDEYHIDLPTGEQIVFRNHSTTTTTTSQQGRITFRLAGNDSASSLARVKGQLESMGLDLNGADEESAETVYWRQMFHRVLMSHGGGPQVDAARAKLKGMKAELKASVGHNVTDSDIIEAMGLHLSPEAEQTFWHDLGVATYGADKVGEFIANGEHLPKYHHMNLADPTANTGQPFFQRIDVDEKALKAKGTMIAIGNNGKDKRHLDYITAGGMASTEERQRMLGYNKTGASSSSDQGTGGANSVFTRVARGEALKTGSLFGAHVAYWSPTTLGETGTYSYGSDSFGRLENQQSQNNYDPLKSLNHSGHSNETMVSNTLSIIDHLEIMVFDGTTKRDEAIQKLKSLGIHELRGLPIEERLVLRSKLDQAMAKVKAAWKAEA